MVLLSILANRSISLWTTQKKKPVFTQALAHGMDESQVDTEDVEIVRKPRWVTALGCLRYSDLFASGDSPPSVSPMSGSNDPFLHLFRILGWRNTLVEA